MSAQTTGQPARRICHLNLARNFRGGQRQTELLIRALAERGVPQRALVAADGALRARLDDVPDLELRPVGKPHWRHLRHTRGCLVHSNGGSALTLAWLSWKLQGTPYIFTRRINKPIKGNPVSRAKYRGARHIANVCRLAQTTLLEALPGVPRRAVRRRPAVGADLFRTGGPAEVLFRPADTDDLRDFLSGLDAGIDVTLLGLGSNALIRDGGIPGVVIQLGKAFGDIAFDGDHVIAGAGALDVAVSRACRDRSLAGLEFLNGIPGTIGAPCA